MRGRVGVALVFLGLFGAGLAAGAIRAGATVPPPPTEETTTEPSTTDEATTIATTTTTPTTSPTTTTTTTVAPTPARNEIEAGPPIGSSACLVAAFALQAPDGQTRVLGRAADSPHVHQVVAHNVAYPADGSIVTAASVSLRAPGCGRRGHAEVRSLSLFGGVVTARSVALALSKRVVDSAIRIDGLAIAGKAATLRSGRPLPVGNWGYATTLAQPDRTEAGALAVHLTKAHAGLPAGTVLLVSFARAPREKEKEKPKEKAAAPASRPTAKPAVHPRARAHKQRKAKPPKRHRHRVRKRLGDEPLTVTPPLGVSHYIFPVAGESSYIDTYGGFRGDVPGNWHHGDDVFAALGTPVLAVADGTLNRVGWQHLGGWRLWVRDSMRNEFYYAHLSGYSPLALRSRHVKAGDVIGFIGNTGDAFTTPPHLHFEIHPHQLLRLDYNGAVNPTRYLDGWQHIARPRTPKPAHPPFPLGAVRAEARYVWRQLLAARGLIPHAPRLSERPHIRVPRPDRALPARGMAAATVLRPGQDEGTILLDVFVGLFAPALLFGTALLFRLRRGPS